MKLKILHLCPWLILVACGSPDTPQSLAPPVADTVMKSTVEVQLPPAQQDTLMNGHEVIRRQDGRTLMEGNKLNGKRHGEWTSYNEEGGVQSKSDYENGVLQGQTVVYRANGALYYTGQNRNGKPYGTWAFFDTQGNPARTVHYDSTGAEVPGP